MSYTFLNPLTNPIDENLCIGDTLPTFNNNYSILDTSLAAASAQNTLLKNQLNTLIQTLTGFATSGTMYTSLSTSFRSLSSLILP